MKTTDVINAIVPFIDQKTLIISSLGRTAETIYSSVSNRDQVLFLDCMGAVSGISIGVALADNTVLTIGCETDGSFMYDSTILHTLSAERNRLSNLLLIIFDNEILESAGGVPSRKVPLDWKKLASSWGLNLQIIQNCSDLTKLTNTIITNKSIDLFVVKVNNYDFDNTCTKDIDGIESKYRFKRYINENIRKGVVKPCTKN